MRRENATYEAGPSFGFDAAPVFSTSGVLTRRLFSYGVDILVISALVVLFSILIGLAGLVTFGLTWALFAILGPATAIGYGALTVGGAGQGTVGMRVFGVKAVDASTGARPGALSAGLHALLFYLALGMLPLLALDLAIGLGRSDRRLGHDLLADLAFVRR